MKWAGALAIWTRKNILLLHTHKNAFYHSGNIQPCSSSVFSLSVKIEYRYILFYHKKKLMQAHRKMTFNSRYRQSWCLLRGQLLLSSGQALPSRVQALYDPNFPFSKRSWNFGVLYEILFLDIGLSFWKHCEGQTKHPEASSANRSPLCDWKY